MRRPRLHISVDLDGIVADLHGRWLELYNREHQDSTKFADLKSWDMHKNVKIGEDVYKYLDVPGLYLELEPMAGAVESLELLHKRGHEVHILTSPAKAPQTAADKIAWVRKRMPFLNRRQITISHQKHRFLTDVFIDDSPNNIERHAETQPKAVRLGIAWPYNEKVKGLMHLRAESCHDPLGAWARMIDFIEKLAEQRESST